jgi:two-component system CheB/CheR fusion protein
MHNLISNALKFSKTGIPPHIIIKSKIEKGSELNIEKKFLTTGQAGDVSSEKDYCHITITDNGIGFDPQYKDQIFEVFQRLHGKEEYSGTGIGLSIVKKIVESHSGIITTTSELDKGTTFDIYIPA